MKALLVLLLSLSTTLISQGQVRLLTLDQMEDRFEKGKDTVYVVNFWATWCAPCIEELPLFEKLQQTYRTAPLKVLLVSTDFRSKLETAVKPFVNKHGLKNEVFLLNEKNQQVYIDRVSQEWSGALPATLVVNRQKNVRKLFEKEFTYDELKRTYLNNK